MIMTFLIMKEPFIIEPHTLVEATSGTKRET